MIYHFIFYLIVSLVLSSDYISAKYKHANLSSFAILIMAILVTFASVRTNNWTDWDLYNGFFKENLKANRDFEIGYAYWNYLIFYITDNYNLFLAISYSLLAYIFYISSKFFCKKKYLYSFLILYSLFFLSSGGFRQFHAEHFFIISILFLFKKKYYHATFIFLLGGLFHRTLYLCAPFGLVMALTFNYRKFVIILANGVVLFYLNVFERLLGVALPILGLGGLESYLLRVNLYTSDDVEFSLLSIGFFRKVIFAFFYLYVQKTNNYHDVIFNKLLSLYICGIFISMVLPGTFGRFANYFFFLECFLLPRAFLNIDSMLRIRFCWIAIAILYVSFTHRLMSYYPELFIPYNIVFFK